MRILVVVVVLALEVAGCEGDGGTDSAATSTLLTSSTVALRLHAGDFRPIMLVGGIFMENRTIRVIPAVRGSEVSSGSVRRPWDGCASRG